MALSPLPGSINPATNVMSRYVHRITGLKSQSAPDLLGGILADDMGLGKSLTMIATIVTTMASAKRFATRILATNHIAETIKIPVKSTLIVVPYACTTPSTCIPVHRFQNI
jgi:SNF2 family DNA or RNA helicase